MDHRMRSTVTHCWAFILATTLGAVEPSLPNIVYILCDDLGYGDVHALNPGRSQIPTPHMDRLRAEGMAFTDCHSSSSVCTPSRYSILTGRYSWRTRLQHGAFGGFSPPLIEAGRLTVAGVLKQRGYTTACIGKWHLGMTMPKPVTAGKIQDGPTSRGFDYYFGISASLDMPPYAFIENNRFTETPTVEKALLQGRSGPAAAHFEAEDVLPALAKKSGEWIAGHKDQPFFLYLALNSPHTPLAPNPDWKGKSGLGDYADFVMETDWVVGEVLQALAQAGVAQNTLVVLTSDNGCTPYVGTAVTTPALSADFRRFEVHDLEARGHFPSADRRGYKADIFDGGHRIPFIVSWPGKITARSTSDQLTCLSDFMATCADLVGAKLPDNAGEDSVSLLPALLGTAPSPRREAVVHHSINGSFAIRQGKWKLELCADSGGWSEPKPGGKEAQDLPAVQLYDLDADIGETNNVQAAHPAVVARLTQLLEQIVAAGRSTPGAPQTNAVKVNIRKAQLNPAAHKPRSTLP